VLKLVERQPAALDAPRVVAAAQAAIRASDKLLDALALPAADQDEFESIVRELAGVLHAALDWMPRWRDGDRQLQEALDKWLP
jgi:hypothetical protein